MLVQHELCASKCWLNENIHNLKQRNHNECRSKCKELHDWSVYEKGYLWNPSTCDCECSKVCKINKYLDTKNFSWEKGLIDKLVLRCEYKILITTEILLDDKSYIRIR